MQSRSQSWRILFKQECRYNCVLLAELVYHIHTRCPLIHELDLQDLVCRFLKVGLPSCALGCLLLVVQKDVQANEMKKLLEQDDNLQLTLTQLKQWEEENKLLPAMQQVSSDISVKLLL